MTITLSNARGRVLTLRADIHEELMACGQQLADALMQHDEVLGVIAGGSCSRRLTDGLSDLDLNVFGYEHVACDRLIHECCRTLGGHLDLDGDSIHFPLDTPGYLFGNLYLEPSADTLPEAEEELAEIQAAKRRDDGWLFSLRHGLLLADRHGDLARLMSTLAETKVSQVYTDWFTSTALDVPAKLIVHSVHRGDYPHAWHWLTVFYYDCVRILFARAGQFFPGMKRSLTHTLSLLPNVPDGFAAFWEDIFTRGVSNWGAVCDYVIREAAYLKALPHGE